MGIDRADIEDFLRKLLACGPASEMTDLLASERRWLVEANLRDVWNYLREHPGVSPAVGRVMAVRAVREALVTATGLSDVQGLALAARRAHWLIDKHFRDLVRSLNTAEGEFQGLLAAFLSASGDFRARLVAVKRLLEGDLSPAVSDDVALAELALEPLTLRCLAMQTEFVGCQGDAERASGMLMNCERLEIDAFNANQERRAVPGDRVPTRGLTSGQTELWWTAATVADEEVRRLTWDKPTGDKADFATRLDAVNEAAAIAFRETIANRSPGDPVPASRERFLLHVNAAFCVAAAMLAGTPAQVSTSVASFRELLMGGAWWEALSSAERLSFIHRFGRFFTQQAAVLDDVKRGYKWVVDQLDAALSTVTAEEHPTLVRDARLTKARVLRELAEWTPTCIDASISEFRAALDICWARHDCEARGQGLVDLASAIFARDERTLTEESAELYETALLYLRADRFPLSRVTALLNFAIAVAETGDGSSDSDQERALAHLDEAVILATRAREREEKEHGKRIEHLHFNAQLASVLNTRGNVVRARRFGGEPEQDPRFAIGERHDVLCTAALRDYDEALHVLGPDGHATLRGLIELNKGYALLDDTKSRVASAEAETAFARACALLDGAPVPRALATVAEVEAWSHVHRGDANKGEVAARVAVLERCEATFVEHGHGDGQVKAALRRAELRLLLRGRNRAHLDDASVALERAAKTLARLRRRPLLLHVLRLRAVVLEELSVVSATPEDVAKFRRLAESCLRQARDVVSGVLGRSPLHAQLERGAARSALSADLVWLAVRNGADPASLTEDRVLSAFPDINDQSYRLAASDESGTPGVSPILLERELLIAGQRAKFTESVHGHVQQLESALREHARRAAMRALSADDAGDASRPSRATLLGNEVEIQLVVSQWGGVAFIREGSGASRAVHFPLTRERLASWLFGSEGALGWIELTSRRKEMRDDWATRCTALLEQLGTEVWGPVLRAADLSLRGKVVYVVPGPLACLPLHAASIDGSAVVDDLDGFAYVALPDVAVAPVTEMEKGSAFFVLSDPDPKGGDYVSLPHAVGEVVALAAAVSDASMRATILACSATAIGPAVFAASPGLQADVVVCGERPTPARVAAGLSQHELIVYVGHGASSTAVGGQLILSNDAGEDDALDLYGTLAGRPLKEGAGVILSACETASENDGMHAGLTSMAAALLRLGASFVLGSLWVVRDRDSPVVSEHFLNSVLGGERVEHAFVAAVKQLKASGVPACSWAAFTLWRGQHG